MLEDRIYQYLPVLITAIVLILFLWFLHWLLLARHKGLGTQARIPRQIVMFMLTIVSLVIIVVLFPMTDSSRGQVITLLGLVVTGVIALASTTFVANVMAGLMLSAVKSFAAGDFIRVGQQFGRVTEKGLFHTEIQTEDRDLTTLPNLHLATNPVTVVHRAGTIISADLSLGYDVPRTKIEELLKKAALNVDMVEPFVLVVSLNDFSVAYRVCGFLTDVENLITSRSNLKKNILDIFHENGIEIVSPGFVYQRQLSEWQNVIPERHVQAVSADKDSEVPPEEIIFDKAKVAAKTEVLRSEIEALQQRVVELTKQLKLSEKEDKPDREIEIRLAQDEIKHLQQKLELMEENK